ncbi:PLDc N-terminal domain-containing protein [Frigoribacterium sp. CFBP9039]|uniref:PLDc N-terminal domain-containing protein n=1 Tax=Frigoribacterium TaxID=96492 RepID=UPI00177B65D0|nr:MULTISPECIES: PLDc N-terminal domain-containing protein [Frigoribacterium]MBD8704868.1 PLDc N-terminal domain-containing protein [Frigoribacterium sp. CFBP 13712]MCJ0702446.1 PLDc N-terminal domain-containing protein [Frigoribacterium faeni]MDY0947229.1 PLDc N-terminal domain-containing protein [Frigoribacterium sp. CFBP9039]
MYVLVSGLMFALVLIALVDIVTRQDGQVQHLPKLVWVLLVVFLPLIGSILWFAVGRERSAPSEHVSFGDPRRRERLGFGGQRTQTVTTTSRPLSTEEQLAALDREIEFHEQQARLRALEIEVEKRRDGDRPV